MNWISRRLEQGENVTGYWYDGGPAAMHFPPFIDNIIIVGSVRKSWSGEFCAMFKFNGRWYLHEEAIYYAGSPSDGGTIEWIINDVDDNVIYNYAKYIEDIYDKIISNLWSG